MDVQTLKAQIQQIMANNKDGHLSLHEVMVLREITDLLNHPILNQSPEVYKAWMANLNSK